MEPTTLPLPTIWQETRKRQIEVYGTMDSTSNE
jgi:hypothetical protein